MTREEKIRQVAKDAVMPKTEGVHKIVFDTVGKKFINERKKR